VDVIHKVRMSRLSPTLASVMVLGACGGKPAPPAAAPAPAPEPVAIVVDSPRAPPPDTVRIRDSEAEQRAARLELKLLEREAQIEELQVRLYEARQEAVRAMSKLQTLASRAEAASGMAEAEVAVRTLKGAAGGPNSPQVTQATQLLQSSTTEFNQQNYGGALYLANQAKRMASGGGPGGGDASGGSRPGETAFATPVRLRVTRRTNLREGPGTGTAVVSTLQAGAGLTGYAYVEGWVRVQDDLGRSGWVSRALVGGARDRTP
jgi:uncharacterized coiled-coil protein SlyX